MSIRVVKTFRKILFSLWVTWCFSDFDEGPSWSWSYGSWIYNYLYNRRLSPLTLWFRH